MRLLKGSGRYINTAERNPRQGRDVRLAVSCEGGGPQGLKALSDKVPSQRIPSIEYRKTANKCYVAHIGRASERVKI